VNVRALPIDEAAALLCQTEFGGVITPGRIRKDVHAGAPINDDGTLDLVAYSAWLLEETRRCSE